MVVTSVGTDVAGVGWGDGFVTNDSLIQKYGLSDPNPFFKSLVESPFDKQVIIR